VATTNKLKNAVKTVLEGAVVDSVFYKTAPEDAKYPYYVFEIRRLSGDGPVDNYILEINAWDKHHTSSRIEAGMDKIDALDGFKEIFNEDSFAFVIYKGARNSIDDEDKSIKRIREQMELKVVG